MIFRIAVFTWFVWLALAAASNAGVQEQPVPSQDLEQENAPSVFTVPSGYTYEPRGRRDPFVNPVPAETAEPEVPTPAVRPPGLRGVLVSETRIIGIVTSTEPLMNVAVIQTSGNRVYFASRGAELFDGVVKEIQDDGVVFSLTTPEQDQNEQPREVVRRVVSTPGE